MADVGAQARGEGLMVQNGETAFDLTPGTPVDVRNRYVGSWSHGFEVAESINGNGYRVRRMSDGSILPEPLSREELRPERRKRNFWWY